MAYSLLDEINKVLDDLALPIITNAEITTTKEGRLVSQRLERTRVEELLNKWNFNTEVRELQPTVGGEILLDGILQFRPLQPNTQYRNINGKLYNVYEDSFKFSSSVILECALDIPIDQSPIWFINLVTAETAFKLLSVLGGNIEDKVGLVKENFVRNRAIALQSDINETHLNKNTTNLFARSFGGMIYDRGRVWL